ncbi:MAG: hypothetical protein IJ831_08270 [Spirochaetales bacterium]|nr:hypothetical protein [Spirochaetales bacterium]
MEVEASAAKRALNMFWTASGRYDLEPIYLFYDDEGEPDIYRNTLLGLGYRLFDPDVLLPFLRGIEVGLRRDLIHRLTLFILGKMVYRHYLAERPGLEYLRSESNLEELFDSRDRKVIDVMLSFEYSSDAELVKRFKEVYFQYYMYKFIPARKVENGRFLGAGLLFMLTDHKVLEGLWNSRDGGDELEDESGLKKVLLHMQGKSTPHEDRLFIERTFGQSIMPESQVKRIEKLLCKGNHHGSRLYYAGSEIRTDESSEQLIQKKRNLDFYNERSRYYDRCIDRISERLRSSLEAQKENDTVNTIQGRLDAGRVYRLKAMQDISIFKREIINLIPDFTIDLIIDASSSRIKEQERIATQAYMITRSLLRLNVPVQVTAFRSMRGYTVLQRLRGYSSNDDGRGIFSFFSAGSNRDGLALRALVPLMDFSRSEITDGKLHRIVLVLTDAIPQDTQKIPASKEHPIPRDYAEYAAIEDTYDAVRELRRDGVSVSAIFWGINSSVPNIRRMYGDSYARIRTIDQLPDAVIDLLLKVFARIRES